MNILIFTDDRGSHKKTFKNNEIFAEKIKKNFEGDNFNVDLLLCPFEYTTTVDFMYIMEKYVNIADYDLIILYTGIVESLPRPSSEYDKIMNNNNYEEIKFKNSTIKTNKKEIFEYFFTSNSINENRGYDINKTKSLVSLEMYEEVVVPYLSKIGNKLIFINSNKICKKWENDYLLENNTDQPANVNVIEQYAAINSAKIPNIINLDWNDTEIQRYTVDNIHLTYMGSEYIYDKILNKISLANNGILFIMGNGPSLKEIMNNEYYLKIIKNNDSFGLNAAYRAYDKYNFNPTYFGCFDYVVNNSHKNNFSKLVENSRIKEFFFIGNIRKKQKLYPNKTYNNPKFTKFNFVNMPPSKFDKISKNFSNFYNAGATGSNALQVGILKKYKKIILFGCDCNYVEILNESKKTGKQLQIDKKIKNNPNYWFNDYQQLGDVYNIPNTDTCQMMSWKNISKYCPNDVSIINCSSVSRIPYFRKMTFDEVIDKYDLNSGTKLHVPLSISMKARSIIRGSVLTNSVSKNSVSKNNMLKNTVSEKSVSKNSVLKNSVSKNSVSKNSVSKNNILRINSSKYTTCVNNIPRISVPKNIAPENNTSNNSISEDIVLKNTTLKNTTLKNTTLKNTTLKNTTSKNTTLKNTTSKNTTLKNTTLKDTTSKNTTSKNTTLKDTTLKNTTLKDTTLKNTTLKNTTLKNIMLKHMTLINNMPKINVSISTTIKHMIRTF